MRRRVRRRILYGALAAEPHPITLSTHPLGPRLTERPFSALCRYCNLRPAGSREHLPGSAALNDGPVLVRYMSANRATGRAEKVERVEKEGFIVRTICTHCNSRSGGNYGTAFKEFALQWRASGKESQSLPRTWLTFRDIQPLRVLKQLIGMFLAAQADLVPEKWADLRSFVQDKYRKYDFEEPLRVFLYRNNSRSGRIASFNGMAFLFSRGALPPFVVSEISWPPLGVVFTHDDHPLLRGFKEVTSWGSFHFRQRANFAFSVPNLAVEHHFPLAFGRAQEAENWVTRNGVAYLVHAPEGGDHPTAFSTLIQQVGRGPA